MSSIPSRLLGRPVSLLVGLLLSFTTFAQPLAYPAKSGIVDVTKAPYNADPTGTMDASAAINQALFDFNDSHALIYLPAGTYRLSSPVEWQNPPGCNLGTTFTCRRYIGLTGAGDGRTILKLDDNHPDFQDPAQPRCVIRTGTSAAMSFENTIRHLTLDTGTGNPGASGLCFMASNVGGIHNVTVRSADGQGVQGVNLGQNEQNGPMYVNDLVVDGFDTGIRTFGNQNSQTLERVTLRNQNIVGFFNQQQVVILKELDFEGDAQAIRQQGDGGGTFVLVDSDIRYTGADAGAVGFESELRRTTYLRNVNFSGWGTAYRENVYGNVFGQLPNGLVTEHYNNAPIRACDNVVASLNLPSRPTPRIPYADTATWVSIEEFGAVLDNGFGADTPGGAFKDDSQAFRDALNSGASTIVIPQPRAPFPQRYMIYGTFVIPPTVKRIIGTKGLLSGVYEFEVASGTTDPLVIEDFVTLSGLFHNSERDLVLLHSVIKNYRSLPAGGSGDVYLEDVVGGPWEFNYQDVWARQFNIEGPGFNCINRGGTVWALGVKTEQKGEIFRVEDGGRTEVLGAFHYSTKVDEDSLKSIYTVIDSDLSVAGIKEITYIQDPYDIKVVEVRNGDTTVITQDDFYLFNTSLLTSYVDEGGVNQAPTVDVGDDQVLLFPTDSTRLFAAVNDDGLPTANCLAGTTWEQISGPAPATFGTPLARTTDVTFPTTGRYAIQLTADDGALAARDTLIVYVFDNVVTTLDHDQDGTPSGDGADANTQGWNGFQRNFGATNSLIVKNNFSFPNKSIVRLDVSALKTGPVDNALFELEIATTNTGLIEAWTYNVFGLRDGDAGENWVEGTGTGVELNDGSVTYENLPANVGNNNNGGAYDPDVADSGGIDHTRADFLGTFTTREGQREKVFLSGDALRDFVNADTDGQVTFLITRVFATSNAITFASKENTQFAPPALYLDFPEVVFPVELLAFTAAPNGKDALLNWQVASERDFSHYVIERSTDGLRWAELARVPGGRASYAHNDAGALSTAGLLYYRLRQVDLDGSYAYSPVREVRAKAAELSVLPNPFRGAITVTSSVPQTVRVYDLHGRLVAQFQHLGGGAQVQRLEVRAGVYFLQAGQETHRLVAY